MNKGRKHKSRQKILKYPNHLENFSEDLPLKRDRKPLKVLIISRVIRIFQKYRNLTFL